MRIAIDKCEGCMFMSFMNRMETCTLYHKTVDCNLNKKASFCKIKYLDVIEDRAIYEDKISKMLIRAGGKRIKAIGRSQ